ncbi:MAG: hypothetical protein FJ029_14570 [Actinobacteria bacterium]|nr:hypothetical protein [Actinomycetota bacterium]
MPIAGDHISAPVTWGGIASIDGVAERVVGPRFWLPLAVPYGFEISA